MTREMLKSKIHRATVTGCDVEYVGSVTVDAELMRAADILPNEAVQVWDVSNGARFTTYAIEGEAGSGTMQINGAAALLAELGDKIIVATFASYDREELEGHAPLVVHVNDDNEPIAVGDRPDVLLAGASD